MCLLGGTHLITLKPTGFYSRLKHKGWPFFRELNTKWIRLPKVVGEPSHLKYMGGWADQQGNRVISSALPKFSGVREDAPSEPKPPLCLVQCNREIGWFADASGQKVMSWQAFFLDYCAGNLGLVQFLLHQT